MNVRRMKDGGASPADSRDKVKGRARRRGPRLLLFSGIKDGRSQGVIIIKVALSRSPASIEVP